MKVWSMYHNLEYGDLIVWYQIKVKTLRHLISKQKPIIKYESMILNERMNVDILKIPIKNYDWYQFEVNTSKHKCIYV